MATTETRPILGEEHEKYACRMVRQDRHTSNDTKVANKSFDNAFYSLLFASLSVRIHHRLRTVPKRLLFSNLQPLAVPIRAGKRTSVQGFVRPVSCRRILLHFSSSPCRVVFSEGETMSRKLEGFAIVEYLGSSDCGGPNETSYAQIRMIGDSETYRWFGGIKIDCLELRSGQQIHIRAFVREARRTLYKVTAVA